MKRKELNSRQLKNFMHLIGAMVSLLMLYGVVYSAMGLVSKGGLRLFLIGASLIAAYLVLGRVVGELDYRVNKKLYKEEAERAIKEVFPEIIKEVIEKELPKVLREEVKSAK